MRLAIRVLVFVAAGCASGAGNPGTSRQPVAGALPAARSDARALDVHGQARAYRLHLPANRKPGSMPLVIVLHGGGRGNTDKMESLGFDDLADRDGFAVAYPEGINHHWNDSRVGNDAADVDDVGFMRALIDELVATEKIDGKRVFVTGASNGGIMAYRLGCELADRIVAIAPVIAGIPGPIAATCHPARPISVLAINGIDDPLVPYTGGSIRILGSRSRGEVIGAVASTEQFARSAGCTGAPTIAAEPDRAPDDGTTVERRDYTGCPPGISITLVSIAGGGHTWPGGRYNAPRFVGRISQEFSATERICRFFVDHGDPGR